MDVFVAGFAFEAFGLDEVSSVVPFARTGGVPAVRAEGVRQIEQPGEPKEYRLRLLWRGGEYRRSYKTDEMGVISNYLSMMATPRLNIENARLGPSVRIYRLRDLKPPTHLEYRDEIGPEPVADALSIPAGARRTAAGATDATATTGFQVDAEESEGHPFAGRRSHLEALLGDGLDEETAAAVARPRPNAVLPQ